MKASHLMWVALVVAVGTALFLLKYKVQDLENELAVKQEQIIRGQAAIRVLRAEWTYLNDPERLRRLSAEYLNFHPATAQDITTIDRLPFRDAPAPTVNAAADAPEIHADAGTTMPAPEKPGIAAVVLDRLQSLLLPRAAEATTLRETRP